MKRPRILIMTADSSQTSDSAFPSPPTRVEWLLVVLVSLTGLGLRTAWPWHMAVEHFDEGVYASNVFFSGEKGQEQYPDQHLYAPPLVPHFIEWSMVILGPSNFSAMVPGILAGSFTVPLAWWAGRRWFGPVAGLTSATLVAFNDVHILFSRTALTDALACFWLVGAVYLFWEAQANSNRAALVAAGVVTGLAWWTKYNGWLPLAIGLGGVIPWRVFGQILKVRGGQAAPRLGPDILHPLAGSLLKWGCVAAIAFLVWSPWLWSLRDRGGYAAVMKNHRGYLVGLSGWMESLQSHAIRLRYLDGPFSICELVVAVTVCLVYVKATTSRFTWNSLISSRAHWTGAATAILVWAALGASIAGVLLAGGGLLIFRVIGHRVGDRDRTSARSGLAVWLLTAWFLGLLATTPLYTPYPRLTLPWLTVSWLCLGLLAGKVVGRFCDIGEDWNRDREPTGQSLSSNPHPAGSVWNKRAAGLVAAALLVVLYSSVIGAVRGVPGWQSRTGIADQTPAIIDAARRSIDGSRGSGIDGFAISTYADPGLLFQLRLSGAGLVTPLTNLNFARPEAPSPPLPRFVAIGPAARRTAGFDEQFSAARPRLELVDTFHFRPSDLVLLDEGRIAERRPVDDLEIYRVK